MQTFRDIIGLWPNRAEMGKDVGSTTHAVGYWWRNNVIPPAHYDKVVFAAHRRGFYHVNYALLANIARERRS